MARRLMSRLPKKRSLSSHNATRLAVSVNEDHIRLDLLLFLGHARLPNYQNC